ncbi:anti-sigma factor [Chitinophaga sp.]|uniref:anti-sigma factor n=1 Tax=Chitinophaga sp. TaxID=1869181 RepID=UPI0031D814AF
MDIKAYIESGIIESYVLGLAAPEEVAELLELSRTYPEVKAAVLHCEKWLREVSDQYAVTAPAGLKARLVDHLQDEFTEPERQVPVLPIRRENIFRYAAAVLLLLLGISGLLNIYFYNRYRNVSQDFVHLQSQHDMMAADNKVYQARFAAMTHELQLITAPGTLKVLLSGVPGRNDSQVTVYWNTHTKNVYLIINHLPVPPEGKQYQLWALVNGKPVSAGLLENACSDLCAVAPVQQAEAFAVTLEKAGGSTAPTMDQMFVLGKVSI